MSKKAILFGGGGFIGSYLAADLLQAGVVDEVVLADLSFKEQLWPKNTKKLREQGKVAISFFDVRKKDLFEYLEPVDLIVNLAAVHREPGHQEQEYYATNLPGAQNICDWAIKINCQKIIFTSSIAVYGADDSLNPEPKSEATEPKPNTPYGISKLQAEAIHQQWQGIDPENKLLIVRPGVIFGAGENGNVTRMLKAIKRGYFFFTGNQNTVKAGGYVKELSNAIVWVWQKQLQQDIPSLLFNFSMPEAPTVKDYVVTINKVLGRPVKVFNLPFNLLLLMSYPFYLVGKMFGKTSSINPARIKKLRRSNFILPEKLKTLGYEYKYNLESAMRDWKVEHPEDWK